MALMQVKLTFFFDNCSKTSKNKQKRLKRAPRAVKETKKETKNRPDPSRRAGVWWGHPFFIKKAFQRAKMASPEDPKINENEVEKAVFISDGPCNLFSHDLE